MMCGVNVDRMYLLAFCIGVGSLGLVAPLIAPFNYVSPSVGSNFTLTAFIVVVLGSMGNFAGAFCKTVRSLIEDIPRHRLQAPDTAMWGEAGMLAGELVRLSGAPKGAGHERKYLNDALIYLQARGIGARVLTGNVGDFDFLNQLVPGVPIILYRQA
jgi:hypothetical protein